MSFDSQLDNIKSQRITTYVSNASSKGRNNAGKIEETQDCVAQDKIS